MPSSVTRTNISCQIKLYLYISQESCAEDEFVAHNLATRARLSFTLSFKLSSHFRLEAVAFLARNSGARRGFRPCAALPSQGLVHNLQARETEGARLAATSLSGHEHITSAQDQGNGLASRAYLKRKAAHRLGIRPPKTLCHDIAATYTTCLLLHWSWKKPVILQRTRDLALKCPTSSTAWMISGQMPSSSKALMATRQALKDVERVFFKQFLLLVWHFTGLQPMDSMNLVE